MTVDINLLKLDKKKKKYIQTYFLKIFSNNSDRHLMKCLSDSFKNCSLLSKTEKTSCNEKKKNNNNLQNCLDAFIFLAK